MGWISSVCLIREESVRTPRRVEKRPAMLRPSLGTPSCRPSAPEADRTSRLTRTRINCCRQGGNKGWGTVLFLSKRTGRGKSMVEGGVSAPG